MDDQNNNMWQAQSNGSAVDLGPLAWVVDALRETLNTVRDQLLYFSQEMQDAEGGHLTTSDTTTLRMAGQSLHDAVGVLDVVERPAAAQVVRVMENCLQRFVANPELCTPEAIQALNQAGMAVLDYLTHVLKGGPDYSVGLFPVYRKVAQLAGRERIHPADLWHHDWQWLEVQEAPSALAQPGATSASAFLMGVLKVFQSQAQQGVEDLERQAHRVWVQSKTHEVRVFWQLVTGLLQTLAVQAVAFDEYVKRQISRIAVQYDLTQQGKIAINEITERLAQDMLYFIALGQTNRQATGPMPVAQAVARRYGLNAVPVSGYDKLLYGKVDPAIRQELQREVATFKELWADISAGDVRKLDALRTHLEPLAAKMQTLWPDAEAFASVLQEVVAHVQQTGQAPHPDVAMEVATSVLFLEAALGSSQGDEAQFNERAKLLAKRLQAVQAGQPLEPLADWTEALYAQLNDKDSVARAVGESRTTLAEIEQDLDDFFRHPQKLEQARESVNNLSKIIGVLAMLDCEEASRAVAVMVKQVQQLVDTSEKTGSIDDPGSEADVLRLGNSLSALSFMLDMIGYQPERARQLFHFDEQQQELVHVKTTLPAASPSALPAMAAMQPEAFKPESSPAVVAASEQGAADSFDRQMAVPTAFAVAAPETVPNTSFQKKTDNVTVAAHETRSETAAEQDDGIHDALIEDDELREIFLEEAEEVIINALITVDDLQADMGDAAKLTNLRRAFHTLKGSGRMVGLASFGEAAWEMERTLNGWLSDAKPATQPLLQLANNALDVLGQWRLAIANKQRAPWHHAAFRQSATQMREQGVYLPIAQTALVPTPAHGDSVAVPVAADAAETKDAQPLAADLDDIWGMNVTAPKADAVGQQNESKHSESKQNEQLPTAVPESPAVQDLQPVGTVAETAEEHASSQDQAAYTEDIEQVFKPSEITSEEPAAGQTEDEQHDILLNTLFAPDSAPATVSEPDVAADDAKTSDLEALSHAWDSRFGELNQAMAEMGAIDALPTDDAPVKDALDAGAPAAVTEEAHLASSLAQDTEEQQAVTVFPVEEMEPPQWAHVAEPAPTAAETVFDEELLFAPEDDGVFDASSVPTPASVMQHGVASGVAEQPTAQADMGETAEAIAAPFEQIQPSMAATSGQAEEQGTEAGMEAAATLSENTQPLQEASHAEEMPDVVGIATEEQSPHGETVEQQIAAFAQPPQPPVFAEPADVVFAEQVPSSTPVLASDTAVVPSTAAEVSPAVAGMMVNVEQQKLVLQDMVEGLPEEEIKRVGELSIPLALFNAYLNEADTWSRTLTQELSEWVLDCTQPVPESCAHLAHSLAGSSAAVGMAGLASIARGMEHAIDHLRNRTAKAEEAQLLFQASEVLRQELHQFAAGVGRSLDMGLLVQLGAIVDNVPLGAVMQQQTAPFSVPTVSLAEAEKKIVQTAASITENTSEAVLPSAQQRAEHSVSVEGAVTEDGSALFAAEPTFSNNEPEAGIVDAAVQEPATLAPSADSNAVHPALPAGQQNAPSQLQDHLDPELFEIFREEAETLMTQLSAAMRQWAARPDNEGARQEIMRLLHTFKGGARLAGAMHLGEMAHEMESAIGGWQHGAWSAQDIEPLQAMLDEVSQHFTELLQGGDSTPATAAPVAAATPQKEQTQVAGFVADADNKTEAKPEEHLAKSTLPNTKPGAAGTVAMPVATHVVVPQKSLQQVRVRANVLDHMLGQTGEIMTSRGRLESEVEQMRLAVHDMDDSLARLRTQLRDMELQAETQMQSRLSQASASGASFDPLEFDRFTRVQELTRMMAESVNDVASVQRSMARAVQSTEDSLLAQSRHTKELQDDLLRARMVEFDSLSERLYRLVRQASREVNKQVKLDIVGGNIEMDRTVVERIVPVFEHLLRNAIVHGIEDAQQRSQAGKNPFGQIGIHLRQEGNDVYISVHDDGKGLDTARIRDKAVTQGLLTKGALISEEEAVQLIFQSGLSTADQVTSLAGRGVGMDVVRAEITALGGHIEVKTRTQQGTEFLMVLPLTTAITQVVVLRVGERQLGVPSYLVETVQRATAKEIELAYNMQTYTVGEESLPFYWGGGMIAASHRSEDMAAKRQVVVVVRSAAQRLVMHVDAVEGTHEVVVKNLGPQLERMPGLSGITVLPSGRVLFIYNPVALAAVYGAQIRSFSKDWADPSILGEGIYELGRADALAEPEKPLIMVVDDSITVRRVTERLLKREGYRVVLAADGMAALRELAAEKPALILSDIEMPQMDGFDLLRNIRNDQGLQDLPVVMITSRTADKHRAHAEQLGATGYLGKPYQEEQLLELIHQYARAGK